MKLWETDDNIRGLKQLITDMQGMGHKSVEKTRQLYYYSNKSRQNKMNQIEQAVSF